MDFLWYFLLVCCCSLEERTETSGIETWKRISLFVSWCTEIYWTIIAMVPLPDISVDALWNFFHFYGYLWIYLGLASRILVRIVWKTEGLNAVVHLFLDLRILYGIFFIFCAWFGIFYGVLLWFFQHEAVHEKRTKNGIHKLDFSVGNGLLKRLLIWNFRLWKIL